MNYTQKQIEYALWWADHESESAPTEPAQILAAEVRRLQSELEHAGNEIGGLLNWKSRAETAEADLARFTADGLLDVHAICDQRDKFEAELAARDNSVSQLKTTLSARDATITGLVRAGNALLESRFSHGLSQRDSEANWVAAWDAAKSAAPVSQELAELRSRLDFLIENDARVVRGPAGYFIYYGDSDDTNGEWQTGRYESPFAAIDAARKEVGK